MSIWFYLFLLSIIIVLILMLKIISIKQEIKNINKSLEFILKSDTNNLITILSSNREIKKFVSNLNRHLKTLRKLELEYKQGNRELKSSITNISHDLRTPLTAIRGYLDLINSDNLSDKQKNYLKIIDSKTKDLTELVEQFFDFSKSIDLYQEIEKEEVCINNVLEDTMVSFYALFKEKKINPKVEICSEKVIRYLNKNMLKRIIENVISNAIKYSEYDFKVKLSSDGVISFANKTKGLDLISLEKIFDRYYTVRNMKKSNGIGLAIAKQLVELNEGKINAKWDKDNLVIEIQF